MPGSIFNMFGKDGPSMRLFGLSPLGGGIKGFIPQSVQTNNEEYKEFEQQRFQLVQAWNNSYSAQLAASKRGRVITPFRAVNNAGPKPQNSPAAILSITTATITLRCRLGSSVGLRRI